ncbi:MULTISPECIES: helix-turn-helix domain-containing protein [Streptomyces]|uniref:helix-turn-helix domain-containing protein n=1 Tax=Streptomyces TaxID=1883 RepID=UPI0022498065|nr:helix-turn-helix domain-containing protein [Streptomyces sp. JHD 1]MCX2969019.1 helix-turn-helix domain-containing protein [Streptomyces sp. JHD 1]
MTKHAPSLRREALALLHQGATNQSVAKRLSVPPGTVDWWLHRDRKARGIAYEHPHDCPRCAGRDPDGPAYAYLLGLYLGDGHIISKPRHHHLTISCTSAYPGLIDEAEAAARAVMAMPSTNRVRRQGCTEVKSYSSHWPCLLPQHGPGKKHERRITLEGWQRTITEAHPWKLIRGLVHSDGCRVTNWTTRTVAGRRKRYEYPRYLFTNKSDDIRRVFTDALTRVGVEWATLARDGEPFNVSVARRASVALMDVHVGPKC